MATYTGTSGDDILTGGTENDTLSGLAGNDTLDGGAGDDTALFAGSRADFEIEWDGTQYTVTDTNASDGDEGTDTLTGIEQIVFDQGTGSTADDVTIDLTGTPLAQASAIRTPDGEAVSWTLGHTGGSATYSIDPSEGTPDGSGWVTLSSGAKVRITDSATGAYEYDPQSYTGADSFEFRVTDTNGVFSTASVDVGVGLPGYRIDESVALDGSTGDFSWTPGSAGDQKTFTISLWFKGVPSSGDETVLSSYTGTGNQTAGLQLFSGGKIRFYDQGSGMELTSTATVADTTGWNHYVAVIDTTQATASDRAKLYLNGEQITGFDTETYAAQNADMHFMSANPHYLGNWTSGVHQYSGSLADVQVIDGEALTVGDFGTSLGDGSWLPVEYDGTYGTNGFHLDFSNGSDLGEDRSGNANDWTPSGTITQETDTPTTALSVFDATSGNDSLEGLTGDDTISGLAGDDQLIGGSGNDTLDGGSGDDTLIGDQESTIVSGDAAAWAAAGVTLSASALGGGSGTVTYNVNGLGIQGGSPASEQINSTNGTTSEVLAMQLDSPASVVTFTFSNLIPTEDGGERGEWLAYDESDNLLGTGSFGPDDVTASPGVGTIIISGIGDISKLEFKALATVNEAAGSDGSTSDSSDFFIRSIETEEIGAGNDAFAGGEGNDTLIGGGGNDVAFYAGVYTDFDLSWDGPVFTITDTNASDGDEGTDTLTGIEQIVFDQGTGSTADDVTIDLTGTPLAQASAIRTPDGEAVSWTLGHTGGSATYSIDPSEGTPDGSGWVTLSSGAKVRITDSATGAYEYDPQSYTGADSFEFRVTDTNGVFSTASVDVGVGLPGYRIDESVALDGSTGDFSWTPGSAGDQKTFTISLWFKGVPSSGDETVLSSYTGTGNQTAGLQLFSGGKIRFYDQGSGMELTSTATVADTTGWNHYVAVIDTTQATASDRAKLYLNGEQITGFDTETYAAQNADMHFMSANPHYLGNWTSGVHQYSGSLADVQVIDGEALTVGDFGTSLGDGSWLPVEYDGTYGTNGFHLDFSNGSDLGEDRSGNANDWTPSGTITQETDTPTTALSVFDATSGNDSLEGLTGDDTISGLAGDDQLIGGSGNDTLDGGSGDDALEGGADDDTLTGGAGNDDLDGGTGTDTVSFISSTTGITIDLSAGTVSDDGLGGADAVSNIENVTGSAHADTITGNSGANSLSGGGSNDTLTGGSGSDVFIYSGNDDSGTGASNRDVITDFDAGTSGTAVDIIDISALAEGTFSYVGAAAFTTNTGNTQARFNDSTKILEIDADGDASTDMEIELQNVDIAHLGAEDFDTTV